MPSIKHFIYDYDPTGRQPANLVTGELHTITPSNRNPQNVLIPAYAPYFRQSLRVIDKATGLPLLEDIDYTCEYRVKEAENKTEGYAPLYGAIQFIDGQITGEFELQYQTIGGQFALDGVKTAQALANQANDPLVSDWGNIIGKPLVYPPLEHVHSIKDFVGFDNLVKSVYDLIEVIKLLAREDAESHPGYETLIEEYFRLREGTDDFVGKLRDLENKINVNITNGIAQANAKYNDLKGYIDRGLAKEAGLRQNLANAVNNLSVKYNELSIKCNDLKEYIDRGLANEAKQRNNLSITMNAKYTALAAKYEDLKAYIDRGLANEARARTEGLAEERRQRAILAETVQNLINQYQALKAYTENGLANEARQRNELAVAVDAKIVALQTTLRRVERELREFVDIEVDRRIKIGHEKGMYWRGGGNYVNQFDSSSPYMVKRSQYADPDNVATLSAAQQFHPIIKGKYNFNNVNRSVSMGVGVANGEGSANFTTNTICFVYTDARNITNNNDDVLSRTNAVWHLKPDTGGFISRVGQWKIERAPNTDISDTRIRGNEVRLINTKPSGGDGYVSITDSGQIKLGNATNKDSMPGTRPWEVRYEEAGANNDLYFHRTNIPNTGSGSGRVMTWISNIDNSNAGAMVVYDHSIMRLVGKANYWMGYHMHRDDCQWRLEVVPASVTSDQRNRWKFWCGGGNGIPSSEILMPLGRSGTVALVEDLIGTDAFRQLLQRVADLERRVRVNEVFRESFGFEF